MLFFILYFVEIIEIILSLQGMVINFINSHTCRHMIWGVLGNQNKSWDMWRSNPEYFMQQITMRQMLEAGVHFGHRTHFWHPKMAPYIFGTRSNLHIINLEKTLPMFIEALEFIGNVAANRGKILFVGTKPAAHEIIVEEATRAGMPYVNKRWLGECLPITRRLDSRSND